MASSFLAAEATGVTGQEVEVLTEGSAGYWRSGSVVEVDPASQLVDPFAGDSPEAILPEAILSEEPQELSSRDVTAVLGEATLSGQQASYQPELIGPVAPYPVPVRHDPAVHGEPSGSGGSFIPAIEPPVAGSSSSVGLGRYEQHPGGGKAPTTHKGKGKVKGKGKDKGKRKAPLPGQPGWDEYRKKRDRDNEAVRRSRQKSKLRKEELYVKERQLEEQNRQLHFQVALLTQELNLLKQLFVSNQGQRKPEQ